MSMYNVRIVLHDATWSDYTNMAEQLSRSGIVDVIKGGNGVRYKLPDAEYHYEGRATIDQVFEASKAAAAATRRRYAVFIAEVSQCKWIGLQPI